MEETTIKLRPNGDAPSGSRYALGAKGGRVASAWQHMWDRLSRTQWMDGVDLAMETATLTGLKYNTLAVHLQRMAAEGFLEYEIRLVDVPVERVFNGKVSKFIAPRRHAHYRIKEAA